MVLKDEAASGRFIRRMAVGKRPSTSARAIFLNAPLLLSNRTPRVHREEALPVVTIQLCRSDNCTLYVHKHACKRKIQQPIIV